MTKTLSFYCLKGKHKVSTDKYKVVYKKVRGSSRTFAIAECQKHKIKMWRILGKEKIKEKKDEKVNDE